MLQSCSSRILLKPQHITEIMEDGSCSFAILQVVGDAVLFVMGGAARQLRGEKASNFIHEGLLLDQEHAKAEVRVLHVSSVNEFPCIPLNATLKVDSKQWIGNQPPSFIHKG